MEDAEHISNVLMDVLAAAALEGRLNWQTVAHQLNVGEPEPAPPAPFDAIDLPVSARHVLARITDPAERERMIGYAFLLVAATGARMGSGSTTGFPDPPEWWQGANADEILAFEFFPGGPDGSDLALIDGDLLERRLRLTRLRDAQGRRTKWLEQYAGRLIAEVQRRRAVA